MINSRNLIYTNILDLTTGPFLKDLFFITFITNGNRLYWFVFLFC